MIDARVGGVVVSGTEAMMDQYGVSKSTARDRDNGGAIVNGGRMDAKTFYSVAASGTTDSRFCSKKVLAISADIRNSSAVVRPLLISWWKSRWLSLIHI